MSPKIKINLQRLQYLMNLYNLSQDDIVTIINKNNKVGKKQYLKDDIFNENIPRSILNKIDTIFKKGINFYINNTNLEQATTSSIFFRKQEFNAQLNLSAKQTIIAWEEEATLLSAFSKLSNISIQRILNTYSIEQSPRDVANELFIKLYPSKFNKNAKEFLKSLIEKLAEYNILVFEFIVHPKIKEKPNIEGFYLQPNTLVVKRNQNFLTREIFTLIHELAHYLLNEEEVDEDIFNQNSHLSKIETWCNDFTFYFLGNRYLKVIDELPLVEEDNEFQEESIRKISKDTHLSILSIYTHLLRTQRISKNDYEDRKKYSEQQQQESLSLKKLEQQAKLSATGFAQPKAIRSPLFDTIMKMALFEGMVTESEFCEKLNIKKLAEVSI